MHLRFEYHLFWCFHVPRANLFIYLFVQLYIQRHIPNNVEAINVEVMMRMLEILWKETERNRMVETSGEQI